MWYQWILPKRSWVLKAWQHLYCRTSNSLHWQKMKCVFVFRWKKWNLWATSHVRPLGFRTGPKLLSSSLPLRLILTLRLRVDWRFHPKCSKFYQRFVTIRCFHENWSNFNCQFLLDSSIENKKKFPWFHHEYFRMKTSSLSNTPVMNC